VRAIFDDHVATADITYFITDFILDLNLFQFLLCRVYIPLQIRIEVTDNCLPLHRTFFHAVKQSFHHCSKPNIYNAWESLFHNIVDNFSKFCHVEIFLFFGHITTADDRCDRRRIRTRTSDSLFFQCFYQRCLCIMCRRLCEMLFRL